MLVDFHSLIERYSRDVYRFALYLSGDPSLTEKITQVTFVRAWMTPGEIRRAGEEAVQDVRGDVEAGRRGDARGPGGRAEGMGGILLHRRVGERGRDPCDGRREVLAGDRVPRLQ